MLNITLTLTAAPELINAVNNLVSVLERGTNKQQSNEATESLKTNRQPIQQVYQPQPQTPPAPIPVQQVSPVPVQQPLQTPVQVPPVQQPMQQPQQTPSIPTAVQTYTMDQLALAGTQLIDSGHMQELQQLLATFGVQALTALPKEQYGAFATQLRALGAKI